jgi:hypothetical protein
LTHNGKWSTRTFGMKICPGRRAKSKPLVREGLVWLSSADNMFSVDVQESVDDVVCTRDFFPHNTRLMAEDGYLGN